MKTYFVILHYQALEETISCVESILNNYLDIHIILVDNHSPNESGVLLKEKYKDFPNIEVLITEKNLGFAKGNNVGYEYAKEKGADFIIQVNNDTIFDDPNFIDTMYSLYQREGYAVLGPDVVCLQDGGHQNPLHGFQVSNKSIRWRIIKNQIGGFLANFNLDSKIKKEHVYQINWRNQIVINNSDAYVLQGCCYIFSPKYIHVFDGMFDGTFMYYEEYILDYICRQKKLKMLYSPQLHLKHMRKAATSAVVTQEKKKRKFKYVESVKSLKAFYEIIKYD